MRRLAIRSDGLVIDTVVQPVNERSERVDALNGKAGLEVAVALLMEPERRFAVRALARELGRSPSTVSEVLSAFRRDGLTGETNAILGTGLFLAAGRPLAYSKNIDREPSGAR